MKNIDKIKLFAFDVDGTLTPGTLIFGSAGEVYKEFHVHDGMALGLLHRMGYTTVFLTGRKSEIVHTRAKELNVDFLFMGVRNKVRSLEAVLKKLDISWNEVAFMGDDLNDLPLFGKVGISGCPADACTENKKQADFISHYNSGRGAAREFVETVLKGQGKWEKAVSSFYDEEECLNTQ